MQQIQPSINVQEIVCAEVPAGACGMVVFGASGDLTRRKLLSSLFGIFKRGLLSEQFYLLGCGRKKLSDEVFRDIARQAIKDRLREESTADIEAFAGRLYYLSGDYNEDSFYEDIKNRLDRLDKKHEVDETHIFYTAVPPTLFSSIVAHLGTSGLSQGTWRRRKSQARLVVEKPFGQDLASAVQFNRQIQRHFDESQIYRIDHYLGKETVQNILMFRFANAIFEPIWNRNYIDHVQITIAESLGIEHRAGYYDEAGALRDIFQNHMLQMLALVAMEPPVSFEADHIRDEKAKMLRSVRPIDLRKLNELIVAGQYGAGSIEGKKVVGYLQEPGVKPESRTETFMAAKVFVDNWRWKGVPFYMRTGKRFSKRVTEVAVVFKQVPHSMFASVGLEEMPANVLVLKIQPAEGISLSFQAKRPGSKVCMSTLTMDFDYRQVFGIEPPEAYQRLLLDCMVGDQTLFARYDGVEFSWQLLTPVLQEWAKNKSGPYEYPAGCDSFPEADALIEADGRKWRDLG